MKKLIIAVFAFVTVSLCHCVTAAYAIENPLDISNNKFGIHILDTSELADATKLVNSNGGEWGYVTIPIQAKDRNKDKWQTFMHECANHKIIPILRITTIPNGGTWEAGRDTDLVDFANFLGDLDWPVKNRYVIIFNEVNRSTEWGGKVEPEKYARILKNARTIFKERSDDFFILPAGLDNALPSSTTSMKAPDYLKAMMNEDPSIWSYIDGWNSHAYPNPAFSAPPTQKGWTSITSYKTELSFIKIAQKPIFITETGWVNIKLSEDKRASYLNTAMQVWDQDSQVIAVTPFLLSAGAGDFAPFSFTKEGTSTPYYQAYFNYPKKIGQPTRMEPSQNSDFTVTQKDDLSPANPEFRPFTGLLKLENLIRQLLGLPIKQLLLVKGNTLFVEIAKTPKLWEQGLSGKPELKPDTGMYFVFPHLHVPLFWMKDMRFPIDIIWVKDEEIVDFTLGAEVPNTPNIKTYSPKTPINRVLEVPAGFVDEKGLAIGDSVQLINN